MAFLNIVQRIEFNTVQDLLKSEPFMVRPKYDGPKLVMCVYYEDAYKELIEVGQIDKPFEFFTEANIGQISIEEWLVSNTDVVIPSGIFKNS
jgi:hypothetical protein